MGNPYKVDPEKSKAAATRVQEQELITLKDDSVHPPPTIGLPSWMSILSGSGLGQPASSQTTFEHAKRSSRFGPGFWLSVVLIGAFVYFLIAGFLA